MTEKIHKFVIYFLLLYCVGVLGGRSGSRNRTRIEKRQRNVQKNGGNLAKKEIVKILVLLPENEQLLFRQSGYIFTFLIILKYNLILILFAVK